MIDYQLLSNLGFDSNNTMTIKTTEFFQSGTNVYGKIHDLGTDPTNLDNTGLDNTAYLANVEDSLKYLINNGYNIKIIAQSTLPTLYKIGYLTDLTSNPNFAFKSFSGNTIVFGDIEIVNNEGHAYLAIRYPLA